ncbi:MAG: threonylcarbamoyl-AMP synthase [Rhizobiales bacterium]|nr:threonylcarbamoyl-AMP synthase [Hyphomicrobiales bacterium]
MTTRLATDTCSLAEAGRLLAEGALVAFPTETVYGLGADATDPKAVARIYSAKGRPSFNPLIAHVGTVEAALRLGVFNDDARKLAATFWPGPMTLVVPAARDCAVCDLARAGLDTVAIRVPVDPVARAILQSAGRPIAAPSANVSGHVSPSEAQHVLADLDGKIDAIVMGSASRVGVESSIFACLKGDTIQLRPGAVTRAEAEQVIGRAIAIPDEVSETSPLSPGRLASHYAPRAPLRLNALEVRPGEACLAFGQEIPPGATAALTRNLSPSGSLEEAAANLYASLRHLDSLSPTGIAVVKFSEEGLGEAIFDRLLRAASPR